MSDQGRTTSVGDRIVAGHADGTHSRGSAVAGVLADRFEALNAEIVEFVRTCSAQQWVASTVAEGWTVPAVAMHIALAHLLIPHWVQRVAAGLAVTETRDDFATLNAADARKYTRADRDDVAASLTVNAAAATLFLRGLTDAELRGAGWFAPAGSELSAAAMAEHVLLGHPAEHWASIAAAR